MITKLLDRFKENKTLVGENYNIRKNKRGVEKRLENMGDELEEMTRKYIAILEEKGEGFDKYIEYKELCEEYHETMKENKKDIIALKSEVNELNSIVETKDNEISKLERRIKRLEKSNIIKENETVEEKIKKMEQDFKEQESK